MIKLALFTKLAILLFGYIGLIGLTSPVLASNDFALDCKRKYPRGVDYYLFFKVGGKAAIASKSGYPVLDSKQGILNWEDLRLQKVRENRYSYLTVKQYPAKSNYGDRREWFVENDTTGVPKIYLRLSLPFAKDYDDRVVIYDISCEKIENPTMLLQQTKKIYQADLELNKYKFDVYPNYGFQKGNTTGFNGGRQ